MATIWSAYITGLGVLYTVIVILGYIALYLLFSYSLYFIATRNGESNAILAWIPIANFFLLGTMIGNITILDREISNVEILLPFAVTIYYIFIKSWFILPILAILAMIFIFYALYNFYMRVCPERALFYGIISALLPTIGIPIIFFLIKDA